MGRSHRGIQLDCTSETVHGVVFLSPTGTAGPQIAPMEREPKRNYCDGAQSGAGARVDRTLAALSSCEVALTHARPSDAAMIQVARRNRSLTKVAVGPVASLSDASILALVEYCSGLPAQPSNSAL
jgi:hypothetical protein